MIGVVAFITIVRVRTIAQHRRARHEIDRDLPEALDLFVLLLEAGVSDRSVVVEMAHRGPTSTRPAFARVADQLNIGQPFAEAIVQLRSELGPGAVALVDLVSASHRYGLPMAQVINQLSTEARSARRRHNEALARRLPVKLSFPLVVCTLPSFVLLAIVPAVMAALSTLGSRSWTPPSP
jgi:tight adherence protein C